jgi:hypothetical protein
VFLNIPPPEPPGKALPWSFPAPPPPVDVIVENTELLPLSPEPEETEFTAPPAPTVIG